MSAVRFGWVGAVKLMAAKEQVDLDVRDIEGRSLEEMGLHWENAECAQVVVEARRRRRYIIILLSICSQKKNLISPINLAKMDLTRRKGSYQVCENILVQVDSGAEIYRGPGIYHNFPFSSHTRFLSFQQVVLTENIS